MKEFSEGEPGDAFLCMGDQDEPTLWAIWKYLEGEQLALARELGYDETRYPRVVSMILTGDHLNPAYTGKTDENDPPYAMQSPDNPIFKDVQWTYLGRL